MASLQILGELKNVCKNYVVEVLGAAYFDCQFEVQLCSILNLGL